MRMKMDCNNIAEVLDRHVAVGKGDEVAIHFYDKQQTFRDQQKISTNIAAHFQKMEKYGNTLAFLLPDGLEIYNTYLACFRTGLIAVPINWRNSAREQTVILSQTQSRVLIIDDSRVDDLCMIDIDSTRVEIIIVLGNERKAKVDSSKDIIYCNSFDEVLRQRDSIHKICILNYQLLLDNTEGLVLERMPEVSMKSKALILYTSGSTGNPKGVLHCQQGLLDCGTTCVNALLLEESKPSKTLLCATAQHGLGIFTQIGFLRRGDTFYFTGSVNTQTLVTEANRIKPTHLTCLTSAFHLFVNSPDIAEDVLSTLQLAMTGGDMVSKQVRKTFYKKFKNGLLNVMYGSTEIGICLGNVSTDVDDISLGTFPKGYDIIIVDDNGQELANGSIGEIAIKSYCSFLEYFRNETATNAAFTSSGYYRSGDLGFIDENGKFHFHGRTKFTMKYKGSMIYVVDVEEGVLTHPNVEEVAAVGLRHEMYGEVPCCFVSMQIDPTTGKRYEITQDEMQSYLRNGQLAEYKVPQKIIFLDELPKGKTGKVDRIMLKGILNDSAGA
eukprot:Nk52_evm6s374 gene=Nk52_evmTU6s374